MTYLVALFHFSLHFAHSGKFVFLLISWYFHLVVPEGGDEGLVSEVWGREAVSAFQ